jgi:UDP-4-amino-4,6-dideoxy-N-acetyl-beta-L-altrosamine transaminase
MIPYGHQEINDADIQAVVDVLKSEFITQGPAVEKFEDVVAGYCQAGHAVAVNSATSALHLACRALDLGPGDVMWTSPITFVASANAALYCGAAVDFVDIDERTYNMSVAKLAEKLEIAKNSGQLPKIVMPVHFGGQSCEMKEFGRLAREYGFEIIEDASHAIGGLYLDKPVGCCDFSAVSVFSFHPVKIVTTGEGGIAVTNDSGLAERMRLLRSHGIARDRSRGAWFYKQTDLGFNYRLTDLQAALGASQMTRIDEFVSRRHAIAGKYNEALARLPVGLPWQHPDAYSSYHLYPVTIEVAECGRGRDQVFSRMRELGIGVNVHYIPVHTQPYYQERGFSGKHYAAAEEYYSRTISLPLFPGLDSARQNTVIHALQEALA